MNPFAAHDASMKAYLELVSEPLPDANGVPDESTRGNTIFFKSNVKPLGETYPASVGVFMEQLTLQPGGGGYTKSLMGEAIVRKINLPAGIEFKTGLRLTATQIGGTVRECQIMSVDDTYTEFRLQLQDVNYKA